MVDAVVSYAVQKLGDFIIQEAVFLQGIEGQVEWLQRELRLLRSYLKDAEQKQGSDERIRIWVSEIQDIAYDTEDIIETFIFKVNNEPIHSSAWGRMSSSVRNSFCCICKNAELYDIGKEIEALKERVLEISRQRENYGINNIGSHQNNGTSGSGLRITTSHGDEDLDVVGFEDDFQYLQAELFDGTQSRSIISILGMGGLGKTTIARKLYNNNKTEFTQHAWICVSQDWKTEDLLRKLIKSFNEELTNEEREKVDKMELSELERYLRKLLEERRYLVVIDDLWHKEAWQNIKNVFPENKNGSRIIITTRKDEVAELYEHTTLVHKLRFLGDEESWSLFCKKTFPGNNGECPNNHLEKLGKEMTAKCGGLPLAIVVLGGLLSRKEFHEWPTMKEHIWREVKEKAIKDISPILDLSYNDLPINIKSCFLYLSIFPEDALIEVDQLMKLWVAEGFVPINEEGITPEEVSECYFKELLGRNLVQTVERNWRMTFICRVHDLVRDLALKKARETNFLCVHDQFGSSSSLRTTSCRRFAAHLGSARKESFNHLHKKVRTLHLLYCEGYIDYCVSVSIVWSFGLLRVLQLERVNLSGERESRFVEGVGEMIHLRYLGLKGTNLGNLPNTIGNLKVLQTLEFDEGVGLSLPKDIGKLKELRHLIGQFWVDDCPNLTGLSNLQTLKLKPRARMITKETDIDLDFLATLNNLRTLEIDVSLADTVRYRSISIEPLLSCKELIELKIKGKSIIREVPKDIHKYLTKLKYLHFDLSASTEDPIPKLEMLPNLLVLYLSFHSSYYDKSIAWTFTAKAFRNWSFSSLKKFVKWCCMWRKEPCLDLSFFAWKMMN